MIHLQVEYFYFWSNCYQIHSKKQLSNKVIITNFIIIKQLQFSNIHSEPKCQIWFGNCSWGYSAWIQHFCIPLAFLGIKDFRKIIKGQRRSWRPNHRPESQQNQNFLIFSCWWLHLDYLIYRFHYFWVSKSLRPKRPS